MELYRHPPFRTATTEVTICPLGDIQWAGDEEDLAYDSLLEHRDLCLRQPNPLFVGMGDYIDFASVSNRRALESDGLYDTAKEIIADASKHLCDDLLNRLLRETTGKWLGLTQGHHHHPVVVSKRKSPEGHDFTLDSDVYLAKQLKAKYLDEFGFVRLTWPKGGKLDVVVYHGKSYSVFPWGPLQQMYRLMPGFHADLFLMGHQTKKGVSVIPWIAQDGARTVGRNRYIVATGGFSPGYSVGSVDAWGEPGGSYVEKKMLIPVALGAPLIMLRPIFEEHRVDINVSV